MWQLILRGLVVCVLRPLFVIAAAPFVLLIATPIIFIRAWILTARKVQRFKFAITDGYGSVSDGLVAALLCPFYSDINTLEASAAII